MDWNKRIQEAQNLLAEKKHNKASKIFEEVAEATADKYAITMTIRLKSLLAASDIHMVNSGIIPEDRNECLKNINSAIKWLKIAEKDRTIMPDEIEDINNKIKEFSSFKGRFLFSAQSKECEPALREAISYGDKQSKVILGVYYKDISGKLIDENDESKVDQISYYYQEMCNLFEDYVNGYNPEEAESDEFKIATGILAACYKNGLGVTQDIEKARRYEILTETFDEETKVSDPTKYVQKQNNTYSSAPRKSTEGCYIATAVYGSYDCPQVWTLRRYRDKKLRKSFAGRAFVRLYYAVSPTLVKWFGETKWFNQFWRMRLDRMVDNLQKQGYEKTPYDD